jgi:hypothetical protein
MRFETGGGGMAAECGGKFLRLSPQNSVPKPSRT